MSNIVVRDFVPSQDSGFIYSTCPKGVFYGKQESGEEVPQQSKEQWFTDFYEYLKTQLNHSKVIIACMEDSPYTILGYAILDGTNLQFVYVKELFRKQGIAKFLLKNQVIKGINQHNLTRIGRSIMEELNIFTKEETNASNTKTSD